MQNSRHSQIFPHSIFIRILMVSNRVEKKEVSNRIAIIRIKILLNSNPDIAASLAPMNL